jgi:lysozyme
MSGWYQMKYVVKSFIVVMMSLASLTIYSLYYGYISFNNPDPDQFPIRGIDVSAYQDKIEWDKVKDANINFAYIKATEGKDFEDSTFVKNWTEAKKFGVKRGAYHFYTFGSNGLEQANHFIAVVPKEKDCLPPVIDIEFGGNSNKIPDRKALQKELREYIRQVSAYYQQKPILYVTGESYEKYIMGSFDECDIWIRDIVQRPKINGHRNWALWQYNNHGRVNGVNGAVDLNVFSGDKLEFEKWIVRSKT